MDYYKGPIDLHIRLYAHGVEDEVYLLSKFDLHLNSGEQKSYENLEKMAIDNLWDSRLYATGQVPMVFISEIEKDEDGEDGCQED